MGGEVKLNPTDIGLFVIPFRNIGKRNLTPYIYATSLIIPAGCPVCRKIKYNMLCLNPIGVSSW